MTRARRAARESGGSSGEFPSIRAALKRLVVPALRERGFSGELPHLRRLTGEATHTLSLRISKWGGRFVLDLGRAPAGPYRTAAGEVIEAGQLTSWHLRPEHRATLRAVPDVLEEVWFDYTPRTGDRLRAAIGRLIGRDPATDPFARAARQVQGHLEECERWWAGEDGLPHVRSDLEQLAAQGGPVPPVAGSRPGEAIDPLG